MVVQVLGCDWGETDRWFQEPLIASAQILDRLKVIVAKCRRKGIRQWRQSLIDSKGRPTPAYYKWLKRAGPCPPLALRTSQGIASSMKDIFRAHRQHWEGVTCVPECDSDRDYVESFLSESACDCEPLSAELLWYVCRNLVKSKSAGGPDRIPCDWISRLSFSAC
eukprot:2162888-Amphidinium_carterae.1